MTPEVWRIRNYFNMELLKMTQNHPKPPTTAQKQTNQKKSLGTEAHTPDTNNKHFDTIPVIEVM